MPLWMLISTIRPCATLAKLTLYFWVHEQTLVPVRAFREILARLSRVDELAVAVLVAARRPVGAPDLELPLFRGGG